MKKKSENFLDYVPKRNSLYKWEVNQKRLTASDYK